MIAYIIFRLYYFHLTMKMIIDNNIVNLKKGQSLRRLIRNIKDPENLEFSPPALIDPVLRDYQRFGRGNTGRCATARCTVPGTGAARP